MVFGTSAHDMIKEQALKHIRILDKFYSAVRNTILGLNRPKFFNNELVYANSTHFCKEESK